MRALAARGIDEVLMPKIFPALFPSTRSWPSLRLAALALCLLGAVPPAASAQVPCGDVNASGEVTTTDALEVLRFAVGQEVELICEGECSAVESRVTALEADLAAAQEQLAAIQDLLAGLSRTASTQFNWRAGTLSEAQ